MDEIVMAVNEDEGIQHNSDPDLKAATSSNRSEGGDPFAAVLEHEEAVTEIAGGSTSDAYLFRIVQALVADEDPDPVDIERLLDSADDDLGGSR